MRLVLLCTALAACAPDPKADAEFTQRAGYPRLGPRWDTKGEVIDFRVVAPNATHLELYLYDQPLGAPFRLAVSMHKAGDLFSVGLAAEDLAERDLVPPFYYGLRAFGPNWVPDPTWEPGQLTGFMHDVDLAGHRFNPNKLLLDPYALEVSHDPVGPGHENGEVYLSGFAERMYDTGPIAPKGIVFPPPEELGGQGGPTRPLRDEVIYEVHLRGFTKSDPSVPPTLRGTYLGAARKASYLRELGVTAIEFLPLHETPNDQNDLREGTSGDNYWGYAPLSFFAPDRRYAYDQSPGGPTREAREMVDAFHAQGIKVYLDVVYNHTAEGGGTDIAPIYSLRGLDNATYYELQTDGRTYRDDTGTGANLNTGHPAVRDLIVASMRYWHEVIGVDGFRADLATILGNRCTRSCFDFDVLDPRSALARAATELPARPDEGGAGVDLIAEPWGVTAGTYELGGFAAPWAEWNGDYRDTIRRDQNLLGAWSVTPRAIFARVAGSPDLFASSDRKPWHSVNYVTSHDGFTLRDLYSYDTKQNDTPWPFGPSDGGSDTNYSSSHEGDGEAQRRAARTAMTLLLVSAGVPMFAGGDELLRTQHGNNNAYNLDSEKNWLDWGSAEADFQSYVRGLLALRAATGALRPAEYWGDATLHTDTGEVASDDYLDADDRHFLAWRLPGAEGDALRAMYVAYNGWREDLEVTLPEGEAWWLVADSAAGHVDIGAATPLGASQVVPARAVLVAVSH